MSFTSLLKIEKSCAKYPYNSLIFNFVSELCKAVSDIFCFEGDLEIILKLKLLFSRKNSPSLDSADPYAAAVSKVSRPF